MDNARRDFATLAYADSALEAASDADVVLHLTEWAEFREMDPAALGRGRPPPAHRRRAQCAGSAPLARPGLDLPRARPALISDI